MTTGAESLFSDPETEVCDLVYDVLVEICRAGGDDLDRAQFRRFWDERHAYREYRFCGALGFGGKFWVNNGRWYVSCYREDETALRLLAIENANNLLARIKAESVYA